MYVMHFIALKISVLFLSFFVERRKGRLYMYLKKKPTGFIIVLSIMRVALISMILFNSYGILSIFPSVNSEWERIANERTIADVAWGVENGYTGEPILVNSHLQGQVAEFYSMNLFLNRMGSLLEDSRRVFDSFVAENEIESGKELEIYSALVLEMITEEGLYVPLTPYTVYRYYTQQSLLLAANADLTGKELLNIAEDYAWALCARCSLMENCIVAFCFGILLVLPTTLLSRVPIRKKSKC